MTTRRVLDLYAGQGGAGEGYRRVGFEVYGVDRDDHSARYPGAFHVGDVIHVLVRLLAGGQIAFTHRDGTVEHLGLADFAFIHASPPCQPFSRATAGNLMARASYDRLIEATRDLLVQTWLPYVIENVEDARSELHDPVLLCGRMLGLWALDTDGVTLILDRHRLFESNVPLSTPTHPEHIEDRHEFVAGVYGGGRRAKTRLRLTSPGGLMVGTVDTLPAKWRKKGVPAGWTVEKITPTPAEDRFAARIERGGGYVPRSIRVQGELLGIDWMTARGLQESIPPAYTEHIGRQLLAHVGEVAA